MDKPLSEFPIGYYKFSYFMFSARDLNFVVLFCCFMSSEVTYPIHVEAINTLLVMLSVQMFDPGASHSSIFYQVIMKGRW